MNSKKKQRLLEMIGDLLDDEKLTDAQGDELNQLLKNDPEARRFYSNHMDLHARLHLDYSADALPEAMPDRSSAKFVIQRKPSFLLKAAVLPVAALLCVGLIYFIYTGTDRSIATLISSENAAWESSLPTSPGSSLTQGTLHLKSGLATIQFTSGVEMTVEAPAKLELVTPMKARLLSGSATLNVPKPARGFILDTPGGYAVDHGTAFAVTVGDSSSFEVLEGEISVHSNDHSNSVTLTTRESARLQDGAIEKHPTLPDETVARLPDGIVRIGTGGRTTSVIRNNLFEHLHPDFLMTKLEKNSASYERRALLSFDLSEISISSARSARLRLNLVPSGLGYAAHLQKRNTFAVYGVTEEADETWVPGCLWEEAPQLNRAELLGNFEVARSQQTGSFGIANDALLGFLKKDQNGKVTLIVTRETPESQNRGLVHAFASDSHPEASGPTLELTF